MTTKKDKDTKPAGDTKPGRPGQTGIAGQRRAGKHILPPFPIAAEDWAIIKMVCDTLGQPVAAFVREAAVARAKKVLAKRKGK